ncbi:methionine adenosyltransferase [Chlorobium ferrooxidans]|uniref:Methionine adenosyltransferase n=1 Tax=Chlorobium ferrooxidans DSM 13031 TaxID=377431 RepID=Q0YRH3_9CHLB|nr:methionine adenosyltransferase [Chlorobium ferrooxidans]EAT58921.1 Methionine adenosyltransferase [Chlorobium ferrooxidans DSM 13031]
MNTLRNITVEAAGTTPAGMRQIELIERKGTGHPDTICDSIMESVCLRLCREYIERTGQILHHNIDKGLLVAGRTVVKPGGGRVLEPMKIIFGDRATTNFRGVHIPVGEIAEEAAKNWLKKHLRFVDPDIHVRFQNEIKPGSAELTDLFERSVIGANDTSVGAGYAPLSNAEKVVLEIERYLNSPGFKQAFPETGEDIKIMGYRNRNHLTLTIAMAFVDRFITSPAHYFERKAAVLDAVQHVLAAKSLPFSEITVELNTLDDPTRGEGGIYLTVLGTSAEGADGGEVGRGNRVNGLIAFERPLTLEAAAGKNPVSHVGKIYSVLASEIARRIYHEVAGIEDVSILLCSQIGKPLDRPLAASARIITGCDVTVEAVTDEVTAIIDTELANITTFTDRLAHGEFPIC